MIEKYATEEALEHCKTCRYYDNNENGICCICTGDEYRPKRKIEPDEV